MFNLNADGSMRVCPDSTTYSASCTNGSDAKAVFDDPSNKNVIRINSVVSAAQPDQVTAYAVVRKFGTNAGVSFTADFTNKKATGASRTGAMYASRLQTNVVPATAAIGAWNYVGKNINYTSTGSAISGSENFKVAVKDVAGVVKALAPDTGTGTATVPATCNTTFSDPVAPLSGANGVFTMKSTATTGSVNAYFIQLDTDSGVRVELRQTGVTGFSSFGLLRRYSTQPTDAPCQPM
jgi:hypothetical protein